MNTNKDIIVYEKISEWLEKYKATRSKRLKAKYKALIVAQMIPVLRRIAKTIARRSYDPVDDMVQAGSIGLLKAIDNYTVNSNVEFRIYAGRLIIGEMRHYLRDKLNTVKVPRYIQELVFRINSFTSSLTTEELYNLTSADVANALNVPASVVDFAIEADRRTTVLSLEEVFSACDKNLSYEEIIPDEDYVETSEIEAAKFLLNDVIQKLPDDCKTVVELYYYNDMNQKQISEELNLTQMSVSRRLKKAFNILYKIIANENMKEVPFIKE